MENRKLFTVLLIAAFAIGILLRISFLNVSQYNMGPDESFYLRYANIFAEKGLPSINGMAIEYIANAGMHLFPNPTRIGQIVMSGLWLKMLNGFDFNALVRMSAFFSILSLFVGYLFAKKLFDEKIALLSLMLFAVSPLNLALARRALQDGTIYFFVLLTLYAFYIALKRQSRVAYIFFIVSFFICVMVKESTVLLAAFFAFFILWDRTFYNKSLNVLLPAISIAAAFVFITVAYLVFIGQDNLVRLVNIISTSPMTNEYARMYQSGSLLRYLIDFILISPLTVIAAAGFFVLFITGNIAQDDASFYLVTFFIISYMVYSLFSKNLRYVIFLDLPIRILAAVFMSKLFTRFGNKAFALSVSAVMAVAVTDFLLFKHIFLTCAVYDPVTVNLLNAWQH
ncbi:MAG: glycosyltransferase family 39 protein [Candidatus Omnitrophica bacterium]|nr:glycosyltransferase family 39 protein [Candidatus Omnitrophota bacterium]